MPTIRAQGLPPELADTIRSRAEGFALSPIDGVPVDAAVVLLPGEPGVARTVLAWRSGGLAAPILIVGGSAEARSDAIRAGADEAVPGDAPGIAERVLLLARSPRRDAVLVLDGGRVDLGALTVAGPGGVSRLTPSEARLLRYLAARPGRTVSRAELLREVWGYGPAVESRTVTVTVQRLRRKIERDPASPTHVLNAWGEGYRFAGAREGTARSNVPDEDSSFVGRAELLGACDHLWGEPGPVTLIGPGGVGKTRLAREYAAGPGRMRFREIAWVDLSNARAADDVCAAVATVLGVRPDADPAERIRAAVAARPGLLLVLDNVEQLGAGATEPIGAWVADACLLLTSRSATGLPGERLLRVEPLAARDALELLAVRGQRARASFGVVPENRDACERLVTALDGLPLAIELCAARLALATPQELLARVEQRLSLLADASGRRPGRHATLRAAIGGSWELLRPEVAEAAAALAVARDGFDLEIAEACTALPSERCLEVLDTLARASLLAVRTEPDGSVRFRFLESVRAFAEERLRDAGRAQAASRRHAAHMAAFAIRQGERLEGPDDIAAYHAMAREAANLEAALDNLEDPATAARAHLAAERAWRATRTRAWLLRAFDATLQRARLTGDRALLTRALAQRAVLAGQAGEAPAALRSLDEAEPGDADALLARGALLPLVGDYDGATEVLTRGYAAALAAGRHTVAAMCCVGLGDVHLQRGAFARAEEAARDGFAALERCGARDPLPNLECLLATALSEARRHDEAGPAFQRALATARGRGARDIDAVILSNLANDLLRQGRYAEAEPWQRQALDAFAALGSRHNLAIATLNLGNVRMMTASGDGALLDEAERVLHEAETRFRALGQPRGRALTLALLGRLSLARDRVGAASSRFAAASELATQAGLDLLAGRVEALRAVASAFAGDGVAAGEALRAARRALSGDAAAEPLVALARAAVATLDAPGRRARQDALRARLLSPEIDAAAG